MLIRKPNNTMVMAFHPHTSDPMIYWLNAQIVKSKSALIALAMNVLICAQLCGWCNVVKITAEMLNARSGV